MKCIYTTFCSFRGYIHILHNTYRYMQYIHILTDTYTYIHPAIDARRQFSGSAAAE